MSDQTSSPKKTSEQLSTMDFDQAGDQLLLETILHYAVPAATVPSVARNLLACFHNVRNMMAASKTLLLSVEGVDEKIAQFIQDLQFIQKRYDGQREMPGGPMSSIHAYGPYAVRALTGFPYEACLMLCLDQKFNLIFSKIISHGDLTAVFASEKDIVSIALNHSAKYVVLAHNHPGGDTIPSEGDCAKTSRIDRALRLVKIILLDHVIVASNDYGSIKNPAARFTCD